jgi:ribosomal protein S15P/S13E
MHHSGISNEEYETRQNFKRYLLSTLEDCCRRLWRIEYGRNIEAALDGSVQMVSMSERLNNIRSSLDEYRKDLKTQLDGY